MNPPASARATRKSEGVPPRSVLLEMLHGLKLTRQLETRIEMKLYRQGKIYGGVYTARGQEAISIGSIHAFQGDDIVCPSHRDMGVYLARGMKIESIVAQYMGRELSPSGGKEGNIHLGNLDLGLIAFISHLADNIPVATGVSLSYKLRGLDRVAAVYFGDGASSRGDFHEGLNIAAVHRLPIVFMCNNNQYAYSTPLKLQMAVPGVAERAIGYGFPTLSIDGNDVLEVYRVTRDAVRRARQGGGPTLIECRSFRMSGHSGHDSAHYVPPELFEEWKKKDPIDRFCKTLLERNVITEPEIADMDRRVEEEIDRGVAMAEASPEPDPRTTLENVYADPPYHATEPPWRREDKVFGVLESIQPAAVEPASGEMEARDAPPGAVTYVEAIRQALLEEMDSDPRVFLLGEDIGVYGGAFKVTEGLLDRFGSDRVIDTPIAESGIVGAAIGASLAGMRPVVELQFIDFVSCAFDQITNFAAKCRYRWGGEGPDRTPRTLRWTRQWRSVPFPERRELLLPHAGIEDRRSVHSVRRARASQERHPRRRSGPLLRTQVPVSQNP